MKIAQKSEFLSSRVQYLPVNRIRPNPRQPRRSFSEEALQELAGSITAYGILQPLTVRRTGRYYELIAGERRLRAARLAGLWEVPCLIARVGEEDSALLALIENLQRRDLDCWEEAEAIARLIRRYGLSQEQAARKLGKSQPAVANKLRLLRLEEPLRRRILDSGLTERHARALLRLETDEARRQALDTIVRRQLNVAQSETLVDAMLRSAAPPARKRPTYIIKDVRLFLNSIDHSLDVMRRSGVEADMGRQDTEEAIVLTIRIPKRSVTNL